MSRDIQNTLFDVGEDWHQYWQGMPEFIQEDLAPYHSIQDYVTSYVLRSSVTSR